MRIYHLNISLATNLGAIAASHLSACGSIHKDRVWVRISVQEVRNCISAQICMLFLQYALFHDIKFENLKELTAEFILNLILHPSAEKYFLSQNIRQTDSLGLGQSFNRRGHLETKQGGTADWNGTWSCY